MEHLPEAGFAGFKLSVVVTRENVAQLDEFKAIADRYGAQLRLTRLRPSGRGADVWDELHPTAAQQRELYDWLLAHGEKVLTGDSFFHLAAYGEPLPGLNLCGAGRVVCLIDPVGDVYACPFAIHDEFLAGNVREPRRLRAASGGSRSCSSSCASRRPAAPARRARSTTPAAAAAWPRSSSPACRSTARTRSACSATARRCWRPRRRRRDPARRAATTPQRNADRPDRPCDESPLAGFDLLARGASPWPSTLGRLVRVGRRGAAAGQAAAAELGLRRAARRRRARASRSTTTSAAFGELGFAPRSPAGPRAARAGDDRAWARRSRCRC